MSEPAASKDEMTIKPNEINVRPVTWPPNQRTSPYAIRMMVMFFQMV